MLPRMNSPAPSCQWPCPMKNMQAVAVTPRPKNDPSIFFLMPEKSATAPRMGASTATTASAIVVAAAKRELAAAGSRSAAATVLK